MDLHSTYHRYYSDLFHNYILGRPSPEQRKLAEAYLRTAELLISSLKAVNTVGHVWQAVFEEVSSLGYAEYTLPAFGHCIGVIGHEWHPAIINSDDFRDLVLEENVVEVAALVMNVPGVGGMRLECVVRMTPTAKRCSTPPPGAYRA